jgi:hypothetical protein
MIQSSLLVRMSVNIPKAKLVNWLSLNAYCEVFLSLMKGAVGYPGFTLRSPLYAGTKKLKRSLVLVTYFLCMLNNGYSNLLHVFDTARK